MSEKGVEDELGLARPATISGVLCGARCAGDHVHRYSLVTVFADELPRSPQDRGPDGFVARSPGSSMSSSVSFQRSRGGRGATGFYGSAGILVALAMGAARVVAIGRDGVALARIAQALGPRVAAAAVSGQDVAADLGTIERAAGGRVNVALDMVGQASSTVTTLATLRSLQ